MGPGSKEDKKGKLSIDLVLDLYSNLLMEIWEIVSSLIGEAILSLLLNLAIRKLERQVSFLDFSEGHRGGHLMEQDERGVPDSSPPSKSIVDFRA